MTNVNIPDGVTYIGEYAFDNCSGLTSIDIPSSVTTIGVGVFNNCVGLTSITCNATTPPTIYGGQGGIGGSCPIYVPCESVEDYKSSWTNDYNRIYGIQPCEQKLYAEYSNGTIYSLECNTATTLSQNEVRGHSTSYSESMPISCKN